MNGVLKFRGKRSDAEKKYIESVGDRVEPWGNSLLIGNGKEVPSIDYDRNGPSTEKSRNTKKKRKKKKGRMRVSMVITQN